MVLEIFCLRSLRIYGAARENLTGEVSVPSAAQVLMHVTWACDEQVGCGKGRRTWGVQEGV